MNRSRLAEGLLKTMDGARLDALVYSTSNFPPRLIYLELLSDDTCNAAQLARNFRNLIHPGRATRLAQSCNRGTAKLVAGVGHSIEHAAALVLGKPKLTDRDLDHVGRRLREALSMLADKWHPVSKGSRSPRPPRGRRQAGRRRRRDAVD